MRVRFPWFCEWFGRVTFVWLLVLGEWTRAGEFTDVVAGLGQISTISGQPHTTTTNPDGTSIDFWRSEYEGAPARQASLSNPHIAAADAYGNLYVADKATHAILKITPDGLIHTFAGTHEPGFNGDGPARATALQIFSPNGLFVFPDGTVFLLDPGNHRIRKVDPSGIMTTVVNDPDPAWMPSGRALWVRADESLIYYTHEYPPIPPSLVASGAVIKQWSPVGGIQTVCDAGVGFRNPGNLAVNPVDGRLYVTDRAEEDLTRQATGLFRIDGVNLRTRITGNFNEPKAASGQEALHSFIEQPRGIAFLADGSYFLCGHKDGSVWYIDVHGILHRYIQGSGKGDTYLVDDGDRPPLITRNVISQPRAVTLAPNGDLIGVSNDSGYLFRVKSVAEALVPSDVQLTRSTTGSGVWLRWTGVFGRGYRVERSGNLPAATWAPIGAVGGGASGVPTRFLDAQPTGGAAGFYRVLPSL